MNLSLAKQPWYVQLGVFCVLSLAGVVAFYFLYASGAQTDAAAKLAQLKTLRAEIDKGHATERRLAQFTKEAKAVEARFDATKTVLPEDKDVGDLIFTMQKVAMQSNLKITKLTPRPAVPKDMHAEMPFEVDFDGSYHNLGVFFDQVSKLPRVINVGGIVLKGKDKPTVLSSVTATCTATTYVLTSGPPPAKPKGKAAPAAAAK